jgi:hypothetical protein
MTQEHDASIADVANRIGSNAPSRDVTAKILEDKTFILDGLGSIGRPVAEGLASYGARRFVLIDPKVYAPESVTSQCQPEEIGKLKVDVGSDRLRGLGADVISFPRDISTVPEGVISSDAIVITSVDNRRADIVSNRRAARMRSRLIKLNVEPPFEVASARAYDFRESTGVCVECQFGGHHYAAQRHPKSCDGSQGERRTNSPRWLSMAAAQLGVLAAIDMAADGIATQHWLARERQYFPKADALTTSQLLPKRKCRWDHSRRWRNIVRLAEAADAVSLRSLLDAAEVEIGPRAKIRFCQQVALRGRCSNCRSDISVVRWLADVQACMGACPCCGSPITPVPFSVFGATSIEPLLSVLDQPLADWGVERFSLIEISENGRSTTFVVGGAWD